VTDDGELDLERLACTPSTTCRKRIVELAAESTLSYQPSQWRDTIVFVLAGEVEIECIDGERRCFNRGATLVFSLLQIRTIRNPAAEPARLLAISRRAPR
jgi:hypothetical protein